MSMNLGCKEIELWQTPTHITYMCLSIQKHGGWPDGGWEGVRYRYIEWLKSQADGLWSDDPRHGNRRGSHKEYDERNDFIKKHIKELMAAKSLTFFAH